ncbi:MAG: PEP-CTERM sorting domain-containing protein [Phycisphaeraceae bacterium]|nr:PEP-CTERM sorting domain-containing protein [Phycisphaeraceae bacterium]
MKTWMTVAVCSCVAFCISTAQGALVASHVGDADPLTEGWTLVQSPSGVNLSPLSPDPDFDLTSSWQMDLTEGAAEASYRYVLSGLQVLAAVTNGWRFTGIMRMESALDNGTFQPGFCDVILVTNELGFGVRAMMDLGATAATRSIKNGIDNTIQADIGGDTYYRVIFDYNVGAGTVDYYINDTLVNTFATGALTPSQIQWGDVNASTAGIGQRDFALVTFETGPLGAIPPTPDFGQPVPEPATFGLLACAAVLALVRRRSA